MNCFIFCIFFNYYIYTLFIFFIYYIYIILYLYSYIYIYNKLSFLVFSKQGVIALILKLTRSGSRVSLLTLPCKEEEKTAR